MKNINIAFTAFSVLALTSTAALADMKISGQVNQAIIMGSDIDDTGFVDNTMTGTRFRITGSKKVSDGLTAGFHLERQLQGNKSIGGDATAAGGFQDEETRWTDVSLKGSFGKVNLGRGESATSNVTDATYGNGNFYSTYNLVWLAYQGSSTVGATGFSDVGNRRPRLMYTTPNMSGFTASVGMLQKGDSEFAVRYKGKVGSNTLSARYGTRKEDATDNTYSGGSLLFMLSSGFSVGLGIYEDDNTDTNSWSAFTLGYKAKKWAASIESAERDEDAGEVLSIGATYYLTKGVNLYFNRSDFDVTDGTMFGMHVKF